MSSLDPQGYQAVLVSVKAAVRGSRSRAVRLVNTELVRLYWSIGSILVDRQTAASWGTGVLNRMADDLRAEFPEMKGFSRSNLKYMRRFAQLWTGVDEIGQQAVGQLPWGHITVLLDQIDEQPGREWYASAAVKHGWSRSVLLHQIRNRARERIGAAPSNFEGVLAPADSDLARQLPKDPYIFDFLDLSAEVGERQLEQALLSRIADTLRELGSGYAFVGRQVHFDVDGDDFYLDLLFFHTEQLRYVVVELKTGRFEPGHAGQLGFYVALVDDRLRRAAHAPTIGILLCASGNESTVRYALGGASTPLAVATYSYESLPAAERAALPDATMLATALAS
jgi:predicted nuclease of restriction endonuclease-like (RecB) superfamily